ncbi:unnamed protein product, partial [Candidula unifasciata]
LAGCNDWDQLGNSCYLISQEYVIWLDALLKCHELGGMCAEIDSQEEQDFISGQMKAKNVEAVWLGGFKTTDWLWISSFAEINKGYTSWGEGQPDNFEGKEGCLSMSMSMSTRYTWNDVDCMTEYQFVCEKRAN